MHNKLRSPKLRRYGKRVRDLGQIIIVTKILIRGSITKFHEWETRIGVKIKISKVVAILLKGLGALLVRSNMGVGVLRERMVITNVVIWETR